MRIAHLVLYVRGLNPCRGEYLWSSSTRVFHRFAGHVGVTGIGRVSRRVLVLPTEIRTRFTALKGQLTGHSILQSLNAISVCHSLLIPCSYECVQSLRNRQKVHRMGFSRR